MQGAIIKEEMLCVVQPEANTPPQPLHKCGQIGGGRPLSKRLTLIYYIFITYFVLAHDPP